jgi:hypothetical protein
MYNNRLILKNIKMNWFKNFRSPPPQYLLVFFLSFTSLTACRVKEGCTDDQKKAFTNNMESTKKRGKTTLFSKTMRKKMK